MRIFHSNNVLWWAYSRNEKLFVCSIQFVHFSLWVHTLVRTCSHSGRTSIFMISVRVVCRVQTFKWSQRSKLLLVSKTLQATQVSQAAPPYLWCVYPVAFLERLNTLTCPWVDNLFLVWSCVFNDCHQAKTSCFLISFVCCGVLSRNYLLQSRPNTVVAMKS